MTKNNKVECISYTLMLVPIYLDPRLLTSSLFSLLYMGRLLLYNDLSIQMNKYITAEEKALFRNQLKNLKLPVSSTSSAPPERAEGQECPERQEGLEAPSLAITGVIPLVEPEEAVFYKASGVKDKELKRLGRTKLAVEESLDLHGCTLIEARKELVDFLLSAFDKRIQLVHIIHGKNKKGGSAILKSRVISWMKQLSWVLAFRSARQEDGGTGALYVLLKKRDY